jgi:DNA mismatch repair protein MutL
VRFVDGGRVYSLVLGTIRNTFLSTDLTARSLLSSGSESSSRSPYPTSDSPGAARPGPNESADVVSQRELPVGVPPRPVEWTSGPRMSAPYPLGASPSSVPPFTPYPPVPGTGGYQTDSVQPAAGSVDQAPQHPPTPGDREDLRHAPPRPHVAPGRALQVHNRYLITEDDAGMVVIDQHALHERILYEQLRQKILQGNLETQRLLVPEPVSLTAMEWSIINDAREVLKQIGIEIRDFGGQTVLVESYPAMLANHNPAEMLGALVERLGTQSAGVDRRDVLDDLLHMISCKAAVKAGDRLTAAEIDALLEHRQLCQDAHHCPHGRPTALVFTREELDRRFKRT